MIVDIETKKRCADVYNQGLTSKEVYTSIYHDLYPSSSFESFRHYLYNWRRQILPSSDTLDAGTYEDTKGGDSMNDELQHHGILGMKWGIRRYQNYDGSLTEAGKRRLEKKDSKWAKKNYEKIYNQTYKNSRKEVKQFVSDLNKQLSAQLKSGKLSYTYVNAYNQGLAAIMNKNVKEIHSPSGKVVKWVAKRGDVGVHLALADAGYDMSKVKRGVYSGGRIAYRKDTVGTA